MAPPTYASLSPVSPPASVSLQSNSYTHLSAAPYPAAASARAFLPASARALPVMSGGAAVHAFGAQEIMAVPMNSRALDALQEEELYGQDVGRLVKYLNYLQEQGQRIVQVVYIINSWNFGGLVPMQHHGFIFKVTEDEFFSIDFQRKGVSWMRCSMSPDYPNGTVSVKGYDVSVEPDVIGAYCQDSGSFVFGLNDCKVWCEGLMREMEIDIESGRDLPFDNEALSSYAMEEIDEPTAKLQKTSCLACR